MDRTPTDPGDTSASYPLRVVSAVPEYQDYLFQQWSHGVFDDYWRQLGI
jgi:hypothetical protein